MARRKLACRAWAHWAAPVPPIAPDPDAAQAAPAAAAIGQSGTPVANVRVGLAATLTDATRGPETFSIGHATSVAAVLVSEPNTVALGILAPREPLAFAERWRIEPARRAVDWHARRRASIVRCVHGVASLDHAWGAFADGTRGQQFGTGFKQLCEPASTQSRALWGGRPLSGAVRGASAGRGWRRTVVRVAFGWRWRPGA